MLLQGFPVEQFSRQQGLFLIFVGIEGRDALLRGAVGAVLQPGLLQPVQLAVPGQQQAGPLADFQIIRRQRHALGPHLLHLVPQVLHIQGHAVAQDVHHPGTEDARGQQMQRKLSVFVDDGVPRVAAALIPDDHVVFFRQQIHHPALAFVTPVDPHDRAIGHFSPFPFFAAASR